MTYLSCTSTRCKNIIILVQLRKCHTVLGMKWFRKAVSRDSKYFDAPWTVLCKSVNLELSAFVNIVYAACGSCNAKFDNIRTSSTQPGYNNMPTMIKGLRLAHQKPYLWLIFPIFKVFPHFFKKNGIIWCVSSNYEFWFPIFPPSQRT